MKIGIAIPSPQHVHSNFALSNLPEILSHTKNKYPKTELILKHQVGVRTDANRNMMVRELLEEHNVDFILHLDADEIYPPDIIEMYLKANEEEPIDVIGAYYFKRSYPYNPVAYVLNQKDDKNIKPYREMLPQFVDRGAVYECEGLGFGGMFVARHVYDKLGDKKWANYGLNFHIPIEMEDKLTHDLSFCKNVRDAGMSVRLHGSVRPAHIGEILITEKDYIDNMEMELKRVPDILVIMPHINEELAQKTAKILQARAGIPHRLLLVEDKQLQGYVKTVNHVVKHNKAELYVYTAQDVFVSKDWLYEAVMCQAKHMAHLVSFNDGKWHGSMAQFGMVTREFLDTFDGNLFPDCYHTNYCDVEISQVAKQQKRYAWAEKAIMMEIDYEKDFGGKKVNMDDKKLYNKRKKTNFDGKVFDESLLMEFS